MSEYGSDEELELQHRHSKAKPTGGKSGNKTGGTGHEDGVEDYLGMSEYMGIMDRQLAKTDVGKSFERNPVNKVCIKLIVDYPTNPLSPTFNKEVICHILL